MTLAINNQFSRELSELDATLTKLKQETQNAIVKIDLLVLRNFAQNALREATGASAATLSSQIGVLNELLETLDKKS